MKTQELQLQSDNVEEYGLGRNKLSFEDQVIKKIAGIAVDEIEGILSMSGGFIDGVSERLGRSNVTKGITAEVGEKQVILNLNVILEYGKSAPKVFADTVKKIQNVMKDMTGLDVIEVNMHVQDVMTITEFTNPKNEDRGIEVPKVL
ncbi:Asp23/Gls24 family envelope stress response protein [Paenibacillus sp. sptzw28]|uniref:Asp23/Gls24 family envelope stress response protein n=1 Tax=Paenibacillus sp. sptzw28 TaxID=715179 RepID=UPI001C6E73BE|nr:Asp23/Gls24 family envelope stress response protein [Paenibacillus sp. sptzw28]QYR19158.1 Asp23/Gls24 family envelope stress response protein [Paenibacillus sp. sptzw28]